MKSHPIHVKRLIGGVVATLIFSTTFLPAQETTTPPPAPREVSESELVFPSEAPEVEETGGGAPSPQPAVGFTLWDGLRMLLLLGVVLAAIYAVFYFLRKMSVPRGSGEDLIRVVDTRVLQGTRAVHVIGVGNSYFLVGSSENGVTLIARIEEKETLDQIELIASRQETGRGGRFSDFLDRLFPPKHHGSSEEGPAPRAMTFLEKQRERLKRL